MIGSFVFINIGMEQEREIKLSQKKNYQYYSGTKAMMLPRHQDFGTPTYLTGHSKFGGAPVLVPGHHSLGAWVLIIQFFVLIWRMDVRNLIRNVFPSVFIHLILNLVLW